MFFLPHFESFIFYCILIKVILVQSKGASNLLSPEILIIPFKTLFSNSNIKNSSYFTPLEYYNQIHLSKLFLQLESTNNIIKNSPQYLYIFITLDESSFYLEDYYAPLGDIKCPYSSQLSSSYHSCYNFSSKHNEFNIDKFVCAKDVFKFYKDYSLNEYDLLSIECHHYIDKSSNINFSCGKTGLKFPSYNI